MKTVQHDGGEPVPPDLLLQIALDENNRRALREYGEVIRVLKDQKRFTFREIAEWLNEHNVDADHNAVYREYTRMMPDDLARDAELNDAQDESEEP
jgi:hypothetical protein